MKTILKILFLSCLMILAYSCKKETKTQQHVTITLYDKPLSVIQQYVTGNWKLQYEVGGIAGAKYVDTIHSYWDLTPNHIIAGNDISGIYVDTTIIWIKAENLFKNTPYTYLLSYSLSGFFHVYIINGIKNDTLIITDYEGDGFTYYFTKN